MSAIPKFMLIDSVEAVVYSVFSIYLTRVARHDVTDGIVTRVKTSITVTARLQSQRMVADVHLRLAAGVVLCRRCLPPRGFCGRT